MKIIKISKKKNNQYLLMLSDNTSLSFYDDVMLKYNLLKPREIEDKELKEIINYNQEIEAYVVALKYITAKLRTKKEIQNKLKKYSDEIINKVISRLEANGYLNDTLYINSYISDQVNLTLNGPKKIVNNLTKLGFPKEKISNILGSYDNYLWEEKVDKIINKKITANHNLSALKLKQKIKKDLINLGYSMELIMDRLDNTNFSQDLDILQKEFNKELKKLSNKFVGKELQYKIKNNLYKKGFKIEDIDTMFDNILD